MMKKQIDELINNHQSKTTRILEIGPGKNPTFTKHSTPEHIIYHTIDFSYLESHGNKHTHICGDFLEVSLSHKYDIIIDRCTLHEQLPNSRSKYLKKIMTLLNKEGFFLCEHAISHNNLSFEEVNLLYDESSSVLYRQTNNKIEGIKYIPKAINIEEELNNLNFKIIKFICDPTKKVVCNRNNPETRLSDPDHLFFQLQKP